MSAVLIVPSEKEEGEYGQSCLLCWLYHLKKKKGNMANHVCCVNCTIWKRRRGIWQLMSAGQQTSLGKQRTACLQRHPFHPFPIPLLIIQSIYLLLQGHSKLSTSFPLNVDRITQPLRAFFPINSLFFHWSKAKEMEMEEGSARVSLYERLFLIGPNHPFHWLLMKGKESSERWSELSTSCW